MRTKNDWKIERFEGEDFIITGFEFKHPGTYSKCEAETILAFLKLATPIIQQDAIKDYKPWTWSATKK